MKEGRSNCPTDCPCECHDGYGGAHPNERCADFVAKMWPEADRAGND